MEKKTTFTAKGVVLGNYWGGGKGAYEARQITANSKEELIKIAEEGIKDGSLDNGMGFQNLIGAALTIIIVTTVEIDGELFSNRRYDDVFIGNLSEDESDFLAEVLEYR
jgi:hypothetical protein